VIDGIDSRLIGGAAEKVVRNSQVPVMLLV